MYGAILGSPIQCRINFQDLGGSDNRGRILIVRTST